MTMQTRALAVLMAATTLGGCQLFQPKPIVENRHKSVLPSSAQVFPVQIAVSSTAAKSGDGGGVSIKELSDRGQAALITEKKGDPPVTLKDADEGGDSRVEVSGTVKRRIVVAVRPDGFLPPGDRVDALSIGIAVAPAQAGQWKIASWTQASNGSTTIEIGKVSQTSEQKFTAETGLKVTKVLPDATVGFEASRSNTQEATLKDSTSFNAAVDEKGRAWLDEVGGWRENLAHNLEIDVVVSADQEYLDPLPFVSFSKLRDKDEKAPGKVAFVDPTAVVLSETSSFGPRAPTQVICGVADLTYRVRHITNPEGAATFSESDDIVALMQGKSSANFLLAPPPLQPAYGLRTGAFVVSYQVKADTPVGLRLRSLKEALALGDWLYAKNPRDGKIANATIGVVVGGKIRALTKQEAGQLLAGLLNEGAVKESRANLLKGCTPLAAASH